MKKKAVDDLESAKILLRETDNYEIAVYHAHQAIEKIFKAELLKRGKTFKFIHDLNVFFRELFEADREEELFEDVSFINFLYPRLRYPTGEKVDKEQAERAIGIAEKFFKKLNIPFRFPTY